MEKQNWEINKLGDYIEIIHGFAFKGKFFSSFGEYILLTPGNFTEKDGLKLKGEKEKYYIGEFPKKYLLNYGDLIIAMTDLKQEAPYLGAPGIVKERNMLHNQRLGLIKLKTNKIDKKFLYHLFNSELYRSQVRATATGSTVRHTAPERIYSIEILLPSFPTQQRIASILSNYDDLIENNTRRIKILEEQAQSLYRHWFVDYKFPGHEKLKMVESGTEFGMIPKGWEIKEVKQFGDLITGKTPSTKKSEYRGTDMMFIKTPDMHGSVYCLQTSTYLSKTGYLSQKNKTLPKGAILVSCIGTLGVVSITSEESQFNQQINAIIPNKVHYMEYLFLNMKMQKEQLENLGSNGATMGNVNKDKFEKMNIVNPNENLLINFHHYVANLFDAILLLQKQNINLKIQRDLLLPRLMSGEILVDDELCN